MFSFSKINIIMFLFHLIFLYNREFLLDLIHLTLSYIMQFSMSYKFLFYKHFQSFSLCLVNLIRWKQNYIILRNMKKLCYKLYASI